MKFFLVLVGQGSILIPEGRLSSYLKELDKKDMSYTVRPLENDSPKLTLAKSFFHTT